MRKTLFVSILLATLLVMQIFAEDYPLVKVKQYPQDSQSGLYLVREEIDTVAMVYDKPAGDPIFTAQYLIIDEKGNFYVYQTNYSRMMYFSDTYGIKESVDFNLVNNPWRIYSNNGSFYIDSYYGAFRQFDLKGNLVNHIVLKNVFKTNGGEYQFYYDEQSDVLFLKIIKTICIA